MRVWVWFTVIHKAALLVSETADSNNINLVHWYVKIGNSLL